MATLMTPDKLEELRRWAAVGTQQQAADALGVSVSTVKKWGKKAGLSFQKYGAAHANTKYGPETIRRIWELREEGLGYRRIARQLGLGDSYVTGVLTYAWRYTEMMKFDADSAPDGA